MTLPAVLATALLLLQGATVSAEQDFDACEVDGSSASCVWAVSSVNPDWEAHAFDAPAFDPTTLAVLRVTYDAPLGVPAYGQGAWVVQLLERTPEGDHEVARFDPGEGRRERTELLQDRTYHVAFRADPAATYHAVLWTQAVGEYVLSYEAASPAPGEVPARPAATRDEPHLLGASGDVQNGAFDLTAAWFDDARVGDGLFEAYIAVRDLSGFHVDGPVDRGRGIWALHFVLDQTGYTIWWERGDAPDARPHCDVMRYYANTGESHSVIAQPICVWDEANATLIAHVPEVALGSPAAGVRFVELGAFAAADPTLFGGYTRSLLGANDPEPEQDRLVTQRFSFALGGPAVWDELNGCRFCEAEAAWLDAPFSEAHLANTLQVAGALTATVAFLGGLVLVRHRRSRVQRLLSEVEAVVDAHRADAARGLLALGDLEDSFDARLRKGAITDAEYQIASQRIATAATRLGMRRSLGLDDGAPDAAEVRR